jgi:succinyl-diaminopimelate desuccinylase
MSPTLALAKDLISRQSLTPVDAGCQDLLIARLTPLGFVCETIISGPENERVSNLWAKRVGSSTNPKTMVLAGHTDVVPTGPLEDWVSPPFTPTIREGRLYGRGAADMKSSIAAFVTGIEQFLQKEPNAKISIALLITSDEEGPYNLHGTKVVCDALKDRGERLDFCIVGEPTSSEQLGDVVKNGRRGSMGGHLTIQGEQGHIAYPHLAKNPIHALAPALAELMHVQWDMGNEFFPATTFQISNFHAGTGAFNVIPGVAVLDLNFRFSTMSTPQSLQDTFTAVLDKHDLDYNIVWNVSGLPFLTTDGALLQATRSAIFDIAQVSPKINTKGGTSDGRFIAQICPQVIEFGPCNGSIHKVNESVALSELELLAQIYCRIIENLNNTITA